MSTKVFKVLSLCDGVASGKEVFKRLGIEVEYHAIEINPYKIKIADANHEGIVRPSNDVIEFAKRKSFEKYDFVLCGFTCTSLSSQGNREDWDGDSKIFFDCLQIVKKIKKINPNVLFFFENVASMKNVIRDEISKHLGASHFLGEGGFVSPQDRNRYYWFNWNPPVIEDTGLQAKDYLDEDGLYLVAFSKSNRNKKGEPAIVEGRIKLNGKAATLVTGPGCRGQSTMNQVFTKKMTVRNLTPKECIRLQGLDNYEWPCTDSEVFDAIGEGWCLPMIEVLLKSGIEVALNRRVA